MVENAAAWRRDFFAAFDEAGDLGFFAAAPFFAARRLLLDTALRGAGADILPDGTVLFFSGMCVLLPGTFIATNVAYPWRVERDICSPPK